MAGKCSGMDISEVCESQGATVHGMVVGELSPVKDSRGKAGVRYLKGSEHEKRNSARMVSSSQIGKLSDRLKKKAGESGLVNCVLKEDKSLEAETLE